MVRQKKLEQIEYLMGVVGAMLLIIFWLIVATIPELFFISPSNQDSQLRRAVLVLSTFGWLMISTAAPLSLFFYAAGIHRARSFLPLTALIWPVSLIISQLTFYITEGTFYLDYLLRYPIFVYTDIVLPIALIFIWHDLRDNGFAKSSLTDSEHNI